MAPLEGATLLHMTIEFREARVKGSHHIFIHPAIRELVNLQNFDGKAKPYPIRQFLTLVERYNLQSKDLK
jgi:hypothetical protein